MNLLGIIWGAPLGLRAILFMLIPWWGGVWFPYMPRKVRWDGDAWMLHFIAGRLIPKGMGDSFVTGAQTHWFMVWFADERQWAREDLIKHENRHGWQEKVFGVFFGLSYVGHFLFNLLRGMDSTTAYKQIVWERDARRHAGQTV